MKDTRAKRYGVQGHCFQERRDSFVARLLPVPVHLFSTLPPAPVDDWAREPHHFCCLRRQRDRRSSSISLAPGPPSDATCHDCHSVNLLAKEIARQDTRAPPSPAHVRIFPEDHHRINGEISRTDRIDFRVAIISFSATA